MPIRLDNLKLKKIFDDYQVILEKTLPECVRINARLVAVELARRTQPFGNDDKTKEIGETAIAKDLLGGRRSRGKGGGRRGIFQSLTPFMMDNALFYNTSANIRLFARKDGTVYGTDRAHFLPDATTSTVRGIHKENFVNGKMSAAGGDTRDIGRWKFINQYFVPPDVLTSYLASVKAKVGLAKSGWAECAKQLKTGSGAGTRGIPTWVTRHLGKSFGFVEDNTNKDSNPHVKLTNTCRYADKVLSRIQQLEALANVGARMKRQMAEILKKRKPAQEAA